MHSVHSDGKGAKLEPKSGARLVLASVAGSLLSVALYSGEAVLIPTLSQRLPYPYGGSYRWLLESVLISLLLLTTSIASALAATFGTKRWEEGATTGAVTVMLTLILSLVLVGFRPFGMEIGEFAFWMTYGSLILLPVAVLAGAGGRWLAGRRAGVRRPEDD